MTSKAAHGHNTTSVKLAKNECFGCGVDNHEGMGLKFSLETATGNTFCKFKLSKRYQGPPGHAHGGIIATILDEAMGKVNKRHSVIALTKTMNIEYLQPVPLGKKLVAVGWEKSVTGRKHINIAEIRDEAGAVLARSEGLFIAVDAEQMFRRYLDKKR